MRPDSTILAKVKNWYVSLEDRPDGREWVLATLMLEFAMRNGDVERLRLNIFNGSNVGNAITGTALNELNTRRERTAHCV